MATVAELQADRAAVWAAIMAAAKGERIKEVWRDGRRIVRDNMSVAALEDLLARLDREIADAQFAEGTAAAPGRRAISLAYRN